MSDVSKIEAAGSRLRKAVLTLERIQERARFRVVNVYAEPDVQQHQRRTLGSDEPEDWAMSWVCAQNELGWAREAFLIAASGENDERETP